MGAAMIIQGMIGKSRISRDGNRAQGGFSLIEVMISMAVLTVGRIYQYSLVGIAEKNRSGMAI